MRYFFFPWSSATEDLVNEDNWKIRINISKLNFNLNWCILNQHWLELLFSCMLFFNAGDIL